MISSSAAQFSWFLHSSSSFNVKRAEAAKVLKGQLGEIFILVVVSVEEYDKEKMAYLQRVENTKEIVVNFPN